MNSRTTRSQSMLHKSTSTFPSEVLLRIFSNFSSNQVVIFRRVSKVWLDVIDNNRALWRVLDWDQSEDQDSLSQTIDLLDEKSSSTIEEVSIRNRREQEQDQEHLIKVLSKSRATLIYLSLQWNTSGDSTIDLGVDKNVRASFLKLASSAPRLFQLILWEKLKTPRVNDNLPLTRIRTGRADFKGGLKILWLRGAGGSDDLTGLNLSSLLSYADPIQRYLEGWNRILSGFSKTLVHLKFSIENSLGQSQVLLLLPSLKVLEIEVTLSFPAQLDCPNLKVLMMSFGPLSYYARSQQPTLRQDLSGLPLSIEELWIVSVSAIRHLNWLKLGDEVPKLKILKVSPYLLTDQFESQSFLTMILEGRETFVQKGINIKGIKSKSLEQLVISKRAFNQARLATLGRLVKEIVDYEDYQRFVEIEC